MRVRSLLTLPKACWSLLSIGVRSTRGGLTSTDRVQSALSMIRPVVAAASVAALFLVACDSGQPIPPAPQPSHLPRPNLSPGPVPSIVPGERLLTVTYEGRTETAQIRGSCPDGYMALTQDPAPPTPAFRCVYDGYNSAPIVARIGVSYPYMLGPLHCGIGTQQFDHAVFIPVGPAFVNPMPTGFGTMTLTDAYHARYVDRNAVVVTLVAVSSVRVPGCL
jgi:hypothetical protein